MPRCFCLTGVCFAEVDYILLVTFVCFFVFVGNAARIDAVRTLIGRYLTGREILVGALLSQVISNVPAATMLASFTGNAKPLLIGVNVGGLGTMIASMASLISYRLYTCAAGAERGRYFKVFTAVNVILLALLLTASLFLFG